MSRSAPDHHDDPSSDLDGASLQEIEDELRAGRSELAAMTAALDAAQVELARSAERFATGSGTSTVLRDAVRSLLPAIEQPAVLVDGDLWVVACNGRAAADLGLDPDDAAGTALARWPDALARSRLVRRALASEPGAIEGEHGDVAVSLGFDDASVTSSQRFVLLLPEP